MAMAPANYSGLANLMNLQGVGVNPNSQLAYVPSKDLMTRYQTIPNPRTGIPQAVGVTGMAEGGDVSNAAAQVASYGRNGDTTLVHMTPGEVQGLASLGQLTINPDTGLPEAFSLKSIIPVAGSIIGGMVGGPAGAAIGSGLGTAVTGGSTKDILLSAGLSFASGMIMQGGGSIFGESGGGLSSLFGGGAEAATAGVGEAALSGATGFEATAGELAGAFNPQAAAAELVNPATGIPPISAQNLGSSFTPVTDSLLPFNLNSTPSGVIGDVGSAAIPQSAIPSAARIGPTTTAAKFLDTTAAVTPKPSSSLVDFDINAIRQYTPFAQAEYTLPSGEVIYGDAASAMAKVNAGEAAFNKVIQSGGTTEAANIAKQSAIKSTTGKPGFLQRYGPLGALGIAGLAASEKEPEKQKLPERKPVETGFGDFELVGGEVRRPIPTEEEFRRRAVEGRRAVEEDSLRYFEPYRYVRRAAEGGIVGLQQGGMPTPQAPSAMASMLAQPQPQQSAMPQQPPPPMPMPPQQMGSGVTPLPDQQKEFMKLKDMEEQVQSQRRSDSTQALATIMGLGMNQVTAQYPQTSPSGQAVQPPSPPPMTYGSQVNLGLAGGGQPYFEGQVEGPGDGQSDEVAFRVDGGQVDGAMLSPDEYVLAADVVSAIGNGSSDAGAAKLDQFMKNVRQDAYGTTKQMQPFNNQGLTNLVT